MLNPHQVRVAPNHRGNDPWVHPIPILDKHLFTQNGVRLDIALQRAKSPCPPFFFFFPLGFERAWSVSVKSSELDSKDFRLGWGCLRGSCLARVWVWFWVRVWVWVWVRVRRQYQPSCSPREHPHPRIQPNTNPPSPQPTLRVGQPRVVHPPTALPLFEPQQHCNAPSWVQQHGLVEGRQCHHSLCRLQPIANADTQRIRKADFNIQHMQIRIGGTIHKTRS